MSKRYRDSGPVPNRWMNCPRKSAEVIIGKFIAFKTPLSSAFDDKVPPECRFPPSMLFELCKAKKIKIGLWIDLTNTNRFYNKDEVERTGCKYLKLQCRGHGETPSIEQTNTFISLVHNFILKNPLDCIAVHCTHGFNRTGFLIVSYIIERMDCSLDIAKEIFAKARPPGIYKEDYITELYRRYDDANEAPPPPNMPDWCFEDNASPNEGDSGYSEPHESVAGSSQNVEYQHSKKHFKRNPLKKAPVFMEGIPGVSHFDEQPKSFYLQQKVNKYCEWKGNQKKDMMRILKPEMTRYEMERRMRMDEEIHILKKIKLRKEIELLQLQINRFLKN